MRLSIWVFLACMLTACASRGTAPTTRSPGGTDSARARSAGTDGGSKADLAMVLLADASPVTASAVASALAGFGGETMQDVQEQDGILSFRMSEAVGAVALLPVPVPWSDLEAPAQSAFMWPEAVTVLRSHRAHLLVTLMRQAGAPVERKLRLTRLVAAVAQVSDALGVYWGDAPTVHSRELFVQLARDASAEDPPLPLWLGVSIARPSADRTSLLTFGMEKLGHPNLLVEGSDGNAALGFTFDTASYLVTQNATIQDGDTIGQSATQRIVVRHAPSPVNPSQTVLDIDLPADFGRE